MVTVSPSLDISTLVKTITGVAIDFEQSWKKGRIRLEEGKFYSYSGVKGDFGAQTRHYHFLVRNFYKLTVIVGNEGQYHS